MKNVYHIATIAALVLAITGGFAGVALAETNESSLQHEVSGTVTDADTGAPLPGVNVVVVGTTSGTATDRDGHYSLMAPSDTDSLSFSFVGYETQILPIDGRSEIDVSLQTDIGLVDEIVVVGYGEMRRETLTGAVSAVAGRELETTPVTNLSQALGGRIPGLVMVNTSGVPGGDDATLRIRGEHTLGSNEPLIVIDGVPNRAGGLDRLNPRDIESISVLKDASAAIYGSQAANGVILVTTRRGTEGATQFQLDFNQGFNQPTRLPEMADAPTYMTMLNEINFYRDLPPRYSQQEIDAHADPNSDPWLYPNVDWFDQALKSVSLQSRADLSLTGGSEDIRYYASFTGLTEEGFFVNSASRFNQLGFRSNIDGRLTDNLDIRFDVTGRLEDRNFPTVNANNTFERLVRAFPNTHGFWPSGHAGPAQEAGINPAVSGSEASGYDDDERYYLQTNLQLSYDVPAIEGLTLRTTAAYDRDWRLQKRWVTPAMLYEFDRDGYANQGGDPTQFLSGSPRGVDSPQLTRQSINGQDLMVNLVGQYRRDLDNHMYSVLVGTEYQYWTNAFFSAFRTNFISTAIDELFAGAVAEQDIDGGSTAGARLNYFSRVNYAYQSKYLLELVARLDGSYIFPEGQRYGFFPAVSVGWRVSQENWFRDITGFFDELKLRSSWGQTGNDRVDPYQHIAGYGFGLGYWFGIDTQVPSILQTRTPNPNITWEVATQFDVGLEANILDNRLRFEMDYFTYLREGILTPRNAEVPRTTGLVLPDENIGEVESWGFDGSVTLLQQPSDDLFFSVTLNAGYSTNRIRFWDEPPGAPDHQRSTGAKMRAPLMYIAEGVFRDWDDVENYPSWPGARPGDIRFRDITGDGQITPDDRVRMDRNNMPDWTGGLTLNAEFRQFDLAVFFQGAAGAAHYVRTASGEFGNYYREFAENRWTPENPNDHTPRTFSREEEYWMEHDNTYFYMENDYVRLKNLEIGYRLPRGVSDRIGIHNLRIYASGLNLLTWSNYPFGDPEAASQQRGGVYPQKRVFNLGMSLSF